MKWPWTRKPERREQDASWTALEALSPTGGAVTARTAENLSAVLACVSAISTAIASLPAEVQRRREDGGWETDEGHPLARLIADGPNEHQTWPDFMEWLVASTLLRGNGLAELVIDRRGTVTGLEPIPWEFAAVQLLATGRLVYDVTEVVTMFGATGRPRRLLQDEVLHIRDRTDDGLIGRSRLQRAAAVVRAGLSIQEFAGTLYENGVNPSGVLECDGRLSDEALQYLKLRFREAYAGSNNAARAMVLDQGLRWKQMSVSPEDAELLASRRFTQEELARLYNVPPPVIGDLSHGTFTNSETMVRWFAQATLAPWVRKIEAAFARSVFAAGERPGHRLDIDLSGLLRGDPETRWKSHQIAVVAGVLTPNEVRYIEGWNPIAGGDTLRTPTAPAPEAR